MAQEQKHGIAYHSQDQRKHYRLTTPFWVQSEGKTYKTKDWSIGGLSIVKYHKSLTPGDTLDLKIIIKFQGFNIGFESQAKIIDCDANNNIRLAFFNLSPRSKNILQFFSQSIVSGEMADIEDTIKRIDIPINQQEDNIQAARGKKPPLRRWPLKAILFTIFYLTIGLLIFIYLALVIYSNFVHMKIESAVITSASEDIESPFNANIYEYLVKKGDTVILGQPLVRLQDYDLEHSLAIEKTRLQEAENDLALKQENLNNEKGKVDIYQNIGATKFDEAESNVHEFKERLEHLKSDYERAQKLYAKRYISRAEFDKFEADYQSAKHSFDEAKHQLKVHEKSLASIKDGHYFSQEQIEGEVPKNKAEIDFAANQVEVAKKRILALEDQVAERTVDAHFPGYVIDVFKSNGNAINAGGSLLKLEKDENRYIQAQLTQEEVVEIRMNSTASVYVPSLKKTYSAQVRRIDRTEGFIDEVNSLYKPRTINDRSALVELNLVDFDMNTSRNVLPPGTPAIVYFDRSLIDGITHRFRLYFSSTDKPEKKSTKINSIETISSKSLNHHVGYNSKTNSKSSVPSGKNNKVEIN